MKRINKYAALAALLALSLALAGCMLARADAAEPPAADRLVGAFVTPEHLDLFDIDAYIRENGRKLVNGGEIDAGSYYGKLYGEAQVETVTDAGGHSYERTVYDFGVEGWFALVPVNRYTDSEVTYYETAASAELGGVKLSVSDRGNSLEVTLYVAAGPESRMFCVNPVYQQADGRVYTTTGQGVMAAYDAGSSSSQWISEKTEITLNGETTVYEDEIKVNFQGIAPAERVAVLQMDASGAVLARDKYSADATPPSIAAKPGTEYLIIESHADGEPVQRKLVGRGEAAFCIYTEGEAHVCVPRETAVEWE